MKKLVVIFFVSFFSLQAYSQYSEKVLQAFELSYAAEKAGDFRKAAGVIREVYAENSYEMNLRLGWLYYNAGLFDESKNFYRRALTVMPYSEEAKFGIILPLSARGEWDEAVRFYNQILANSPGNTLALFRLGMIHYNRREWIQAAKNFQKVVDLYPFDYDGMLMMAWTNLQLGKSREARILFNKVLLYSPGDASALEGLGLLK